MGKNKIKVKTTGLVLMMVSKGIFSFGQSSKDPVYFGTMDLVKSKEAVNRTNSSAAKPTSIWATEWSNDGQYIAVGGDDSTVWMYHGKDYNFYKKFSLHAPVKHLSWHPNENLLAIATTKGAHLLHMKAEVLVDVPDIIVGGRAIGWNYNGELLGLADGRGVLQVMDKNGKLLRSIKKHNNHSYATMDWHPSKNIIVTGSDEIILFDTSGKQLAFIKQRPENTLLLTARWHPSGDFFATGDYGHENEGKPTLLQFWEPDGTLIKQMLGHHEEMRNLKWNKEGTLLATASDGLRIWKSDGKLLYETVQAEVLWGLSWNKENDKLIAGSFNGQLVIWDAKAKRVKEFH